MTHLINDPRQFPAESLRGMVAANRTYMQPVHGGVVRTTTSPHGEVSVVVGGGSGHYPAFAGWVGPGMAHGAVCGNIFASPSASQVESVVRAADNGGGCLLLFGNYAGDVLHFGMARDALVASGLDTRIVTVSDDVASNTVEHHDDRRGIAGDLFVVKAACAAAAAGRDLDAVEAAARRANEASRSLGVAFTGCTLPGAAEPLFTVPDGTYALGLGIHGEPGIERRTFKGLDDTVAQMFATLIDNGSYHRTLRLWNAASASWDEVQQEKQPLAKGDRVIALVNNLGSVPLSECYGVYHALARCCADFGLSIARSLVGNFCTSLDMQGLSITLLKADDATLELFDAPVRTPGWTNGGRA